MEQVPADLVGTRIAAQVAFLSVEVDTFRTVDGVEFDRVSVRHPGAVAIVPVLNGTVLLLRQFRTPLRAMMLEIPAGKLDVAGESPRAAAGRECEEEIGYRPGNLEHLRTIHTTPGFSDERIELYVATDLIEVGTQPDGVEEHHSEIVQLTFSEVRKAIAEEAITDAKTLIGLHDVLERYNSSEASTA